MNLSCNHWLEELDIPEILKEEITRCICSKLRNFLELRWRYYPWKHEEDKEIVDGLEDIRVMIHNIIKSLDVSVPRAPVHLPNS